MSKHEIEQALWPGRNNSHPRSDKEKRTADGIVFASIPEKNRYLQLRLLVKCGAIRKLQYEPIFIFEFNGVKIGSYSPDFQYIDCTTEEPIIEDVKGTKVTKAGNRIARYSREFPYQRGLMKALFGLEVKIIFDVDCK